MTNVYNVTVNPNKSKVVDTGYTFSQGDFGFQLAITVEELDTTGTTCKIAFRKPSGSVEATGLTASGNTYTYTIRGTELDTPGPVVADLKFINSTTQRISTASFIFLVTADTLNGAADTAHSYSDTIQQLVDELDGSVVRIKQDLTDLREDMFEKQTNLFNYKSEAIINGKYVMRLGLRPIEGIAQGYRITHPIYVKGGTTYKSPFDTVAVGGNNPYYGICDEDGNWIESKEGTIDGNFLTFTPSETCYVMLNIGKLDITTFMVCEANSYPQTYVPYTYEYILNEKVEFNEKHKKEINPLEGKIIALNGDSICYGAGYVGGYGKIIAENNNMTVQNIAVAGATITTGTTASHNIATTIENMRSDADFAIIEGGVNDASIEVPIGTITNGFDKTYDLTTFAGAFEQMLKSLHIRFAGKKIGYIAVHKMVWGYRNDVGDLTNNYYKVAKACCEKWGVPFLDLNGTVPPFGSWRYASEPELYALTTAYTKEKSTGSGIGDGWHPNEAGYRKYYVPKIEAWLKTL